MPGSDCETQTDKVLPNLAVREREKREMHFNIAHNISLNFILFAEKFT